MTSPFTATTRVLTCMQCGAPQGVPLEGGAVACRYCGAVTQHATRPPPAAQVPGDAAMEAERRTRLAAQMAIPPTMSPVVFHFAGLNAIAVIPDERLHEALATWKTCLDRVRAGDDPAAEDLVQLTNALNSTLRARDPLRVRALLETAREAVRSPTHRNELLGMLARSACLDGDPSAAEGWLSAMDATPTELRADSAYRASAAIYFTLRRDYPRVLSLLGMQLGQVPIHNQSTLLATVLRASALAQLGHVAEARAQLSRIPNAQALLPQVAQRWAVLGLFLG